MKRMLIAIVLAASALIHPVTGTASEERKPLVIMISGVLTDPFFSAIKKGFDDALAATGVDGQYSTISSFDNVQADIARLLEAAVARKPDALLVADFFPDAMNPILKSAVAQGIPVVLHNSGESVWKELGALTYIGEEPYTTGSVVGEHLAEIGVKNAICVNHVPGQPALEQRCAGFDEAIRKAGGASKVLSISTQDMQNPQANLQAIKGALESDPGIDGIFTLGITQATAAVLALKDQGLQGKVTIGSTDISTAMLHSVKSGHIELIADQQPYIQSYYSVIVAAQYVKFGLRPIGPIHTGPFIITKDNVDRVLEANVNYGGVRGAR